MIGKIKQSELLKAPYIKIKAKVIAPGTTNGKPNISYEEEYVVAPSAKKIATYITNQLFGSDLVTQTENLDINWLMPTLSESLEKAIYQTESFIYLHKYNNKVYLECLNKNEIHDLVQIFDEVKEAKIIQEFTDGDDVYELKRHIFINGNGTSLIKFSAYIRERNNDLREITIESFNRIFGTEYSKVENKPYEVLLNIDTGRDFFRDSKKLLNEEMEVINTIAEEIEKTKTRIATTTHFQSGDIATSWAPNSTNYNVSTLNVKSMQDYFVLLPGDRDHYTFQYLQGDVRTEDYENTFKFYDYQIIQMAGLSTATFGYEKDSYMNVANVDLSANASEMTIEAIKRQLEPQINRLIENIIRLQKTQKIKINVIPSELSWDYGANERFDDMKKLEVLQVIQRTGSVPYSIKAKIINPILNKMIDEDIKTDDLIKEWQDEQNKMNIEFGEI